MGAAQIQEGQSQLLVGEYKHMQQQLKNQALQTAGQMLENLQPNKQPQPVSATIYRQPQQAQLAQQPSTEELVGNLLQLQPYETAQYSAVALAIPVVMRMLQRR